MPEALRRLLEAMRKRYDRARVADAAALPEAEARYARVARAARVVLEYRGERK